MPDQIPFDLGHVFRRAATGVLCSAALLAGAATFPATAANDPLRGSVQLDQPTVLGGGNTVVYAVVNFEGIDVDPGVTKERPPLNLSLVLDRSGSMEDEGKIEYLRRAAKLAVDRLGPKDTLSIVEYDDQITLMWPARRVKNTGEVKRMIDGLDPRGSTNLTGGMLRGVDEAKKALDGPADEDGTITRVILMSDGLANTGITDRAEIARLVRGAKSDGIRISAMGLGRDYDEDLMQAVAENGGGRYYYIERPTQMARVFQEELGSLFETCARDVEIRFSGTAVIRKAEVVGYDDATGTKDTKRGLDDVFEGEKRSVLLRLEVATPSSGHVDLGQVTVNYKTAKGGEAKSFNQALAVDVTNDKAAVARARNKDASAQAALAESDRIQAEQVKLVQAGKHDEAKRNMAALAKDLEEKNRSLNDERLKRKIEAVNVENEQMTRAAASPEVQKDYLKSSKQRLYQAKAGKRAGYSLQLGDKGIEVERLQEALKQQGAYKGPIDGVYDEDVKKAVEAYQRSNKMDADGVAGAATMDKMGAY
ncbi:MAG: VWA domain-containing protein [Alphaproteobacteria bacterium]|nr:VWA domain-containing protein [Alphaproteobacteria bacterium]